MKMYTTCTHNKHTLANSRKLKNNQLLRRECHDSTFTDDQEVSMYFEPIWKRIYVK